MLQTFVQKTELYPDCKKLFDTIDSILILVLCHDFGYLFDENSEDHLNGRSSCREPIFINWRFWNPLSIPRNPTELPTMKLSHESVPFRFSIFDETEEDYFGFRSSH